MIPECLARAQGRWIEAQRKATRLVAGARHPGTPADWAEGVRWISRLAGIAFEWVVEKNDPLHPVIFRQQDEYRKFIVDNPDLNYYFAVLDDRLTYRLRGTRGEAAYVGLTLGTDIFHWGTGEGGPMGTLTQCHLDQFTLGDDGAFEIVLSPRPHDGNWIELEPRTQHLAVRETFTDRRRQRPAAFHLERVGERLPAPQITPEELARKLELAASFMLFVVETCIAMYAGSEGAINTITGGAGSERVAAQAGEVESHCDTDMAYMGGRWRLEAGQGLVVTIRPPERPFIYWGLTLANPWCESYDYRFTRPCVNHHTAAREPDGSWRLVIAAEDPGCPNWLDTGGRLEGQMLLRWVLASRPPEPACELVPLRALGG